MKELDSPKSLGFRAVPMIATANGTFVTLLGAGPS
jgi:hypothetical protein